MQCSGASREGSHTYTDGESITYRTDRSQRGGTRRYAGSGASWDEAAPGRGLTPTSVSTQTGPSRRLDPAGELTDSLIQLRATAERLEQGLQRLEGVVGNLVARATALPETPLVVRQQEAPAVHVLRMEARSDPQPEPERAAEVVPSRPEVKVSMFTGGDAMAVLGQVRVIGADQ